MLIDIKYSINDSIYSMYNNKVYHEHITSILTDTQINSKGVIKTEVRYKTNNARVLDEDKVFSSKEELLKSL